MGHILKPLLRHPAMPVLMMVQVALACAIACNALCLLHQKLMPLTAPDGVGNPAQLLVVTGLYARGKPWGPARLRAVQTELRALPGVKSASYAASFPMTSGGQIKANYQRPQGKTAVSTSIYLGDNLVQTLDLHLVAGRDFTAAEESTTEGSGMGFGQAGPAIITRALAKRLFPNGHALGETLVFSDKGPARTVVGIVGHLMRNGLGGNNRANLDYSMLFPGVPKQWPRPRFAVRVTAHANIARLRKSIRGVIEQELGDRMLRGYTPSVVSFATLRQRMLAPEQSAVWLFAGVTLIVLIVTLSGIMGMTGYWVRQRTRQIGIRRALGARRGNIFRAFQIENLLVVGAGVILGMIFAYAINLWLMQHYTLSRLPWGYLPIGAVVLLVLGQLATLAPARRAACIPPMVATRAA